MARRKGFLGAVAQIQRDIERAERARQREERAALREQQRAQRELERARKAEERAARESERERKRLHQEARIAEAEAMNASLEAKLADLASILSDTLDVDDHIEFSSLKLTFEPKAFSPGQLAIASPPPAKPAAPEPLSFFKRMSRKAVERRAREDSERHERHEADLAEHERAETARRATLDAARERHEEEQRSEQARLEQQHLEIDQFQADFEASDPHAVSQYFGLVLQSSLYPDDFPRHSRVAYVPESRQLVVEIELPSLEVIPDVKLFKYVKSRDEITSTKRAQADVRRIYADLIAQTSLRTIHELFEADRTAQLETVVLNGFVSSLDPATGRDVSPCLISVRTTRNSFGELNLSRVEPLACLKALDAAVSAKPTDLAPVRPVLEFSMVDPRFVEETDVLSEIDHRANLMEMTPYDFENLISNLFERMGLETRQTRASRDGGVDCVAYDPRPIFGGKVVIQAKRYKNTVGVSAVRDLFGTVQNEGASKGILVTTSGYGQSSYEFASGKPLELLDGANLLYLLAEHAGLEARIEAPKDWTDPS